VAAGKSRPFILDLVFGGSWLDEVRASVELMRQHGEKRMAQLSAPLTIVQTSWLGVADIEALTAEEWDDRLFAADGTLLRAFPSHVEQRYILHYSYMSGTWRVVESQIVRSQ
jgi:hypothetical protein